MNNEEAVLFLFKITTEIKRSFECPVILFTMKDYAVGIFNSLVNMRTALLQNSKPERIAEIVDASHIEWLQAVQDIETFKKRIKDTPREVILKSIDFTMECINKRHKYFQKYIEQTQKSVTGRERTQMQLDMNIIRDMQETVYFALIEKQKCISFAADKADFCAIVLNEVEELLNWLDNLYDHLVEQFSQVLKLKLPQLHSKLTRTLKATIDEVASYSTQNADAKKIAEELSSKGRRLGSIARVVTTYKDLEISKIMEKIKHLEDRISRMKDESASAGIMALQHKAIYLEDRLESIENLKLSLHYLKSKTKSNTLDGNIVNVENNIRVFNHLLPRKDRCRLVDKLIEIWQTAIGNTEVKSVISILSATDVKEVYSDDIGHFTIDKYGRKIYAMTDEDRSKNFQLNEHNELVPVNDDEHPYFFDDIGRYYLDENRERVYKAHSNASEYTLRRAGIMMKLSETENGIEYRYDDLGRYYIDGNGSHIYREKDSSEEYRSDGLGNLVRIQLEDKYYETCPVEPMVTKESLYLKETVGPALKTCLAEIVLTQPSDPIKYLADSLEKYSRNKEARHTRLLEEQAMMEEKKNIIPEHVSPPLSSGEYFIDHDFTDYESYKY